MRLPGSVLRSAKNRRVLTYVEERQNRSSNRCLSKKKDERQKSKKARK